MSAKKDKTGDVSWQEVTFRIERHKQFHKIAKEHYEKAKKCKGHAIIASGSRKDGGSCKVEYDKEWENILIISVIFSALTIEAVINEYAILNLSKGYLDHYLRNLGVVEKWIIIPRIVTGKEIDRNSYAFQNLKPLMSTRNDLAHYKAGNIEISDLNANPVPHILTLNHAGHGIKIAVALVQELKKLSDTHLVPALD